jgi:hypothetical protein
VRREEFEHAIRAAGAILGVDELLIIGSQALHGSVPGAVAEAVTQSVEVDIAVRGDADGRLADLLDGSIGEGSLFHETFGYYAQGVVEATAMLPRGWHDRLVQFASPATNDVVAWCLEPHDLWISKAIAGRPKDIAFCKALVHTALVDSELLRKRLDDVDGIPAQVRAAVAAMIPTR